MKTKKLRYKNVKNSLRGSKVTTIKVKVDTENNVNKKYTNYYKKIFAAKYFGKNVNVVIAK